MMHVWKTNLDCMIGYFFSVVCGLISALFSRSLSVYFLEMANSVKCPFEISLALYTSGNVDSPLQVDRIVCFVAAVATTF